MKNDLQKEGVRMKALVLSDSHKNFNSIRRAVEREPDADLLIHAGDVQRDVDDILDAWPELPCEYVLGNNDFCVTGVPSQRLFEFGGKRIFLTHGHMYRVKSSTARLVQKARAMGADICIFGHTHLPCLEEQDGIWVLNPGTAWRSYATIEITDGEVSIQIKR